MQYCGMGRRALLRGGTGLLASAAASRQAAAQAGFDWMRCKGQKLEVAFQRSAFCDVLERNHKEFTGLTGITVGSEQVPEQQYRQKLVIQFSSGNPGVDVCYLALTSQKRLFGKGKWLEDLRPYIADAKLTNPDFDFADFSKPSIEYATQSDGRLDTIPITFAYNVLMWNKALFAAKGVDYPRSFPEILDAARLLHDPKNGVSGFIGRGIKNANVPVWTTFLLGFGVDAVTADGKLNTDTPEAIEAARMYQRLNRDSGAPGVSGFNWNECQATFMLGGAAMFLDTTTVAQPVGDPTRSRVADVVGYGVMPPGPKKQVAPLFGDGLGISAKSPHKEAAWLYIQWATGKLNQERQLLGGYGAAVRNSAFTAASASPDLKAPKPWLDAVRESSPIAHQCLPAIVAVGEFRDVFGIALTNMIGGADPAEELRRATREFRPVLARTEA